MSDLRLIILLAISSLIGALGGFCIMLFPLLIFLFAAGDAGSIDTQLRVGFFFIFAVGFAIAGILTVTMMRIFIGSQIISIKEGAMPFAGGSVIGALVASPCLSLENFMGAAALGILLTFAIGDTVCWLKMRANVDEESLTALNLNDRR